MMIEQMKINGNHSQDTSDISTSNPKEIKTVKDNVEVRICNKNFIKLTARGISNGVTPTIDDDTIILNGTATSNYANITSWTDCNIKSGEYTFSVDKAQSFKINIRCVFRDNTNVDVSLAAGATSVKVNFTKTVSRLYIYVLDVLNKTFENLSFRVQLEKGLVATSIIRHEEQTVTMPIQQEMLEGDYIEDAEHHEWGKVILTGNDFNYLVQQNKKGLNYFIFRHPLVKIKGRIISNMLKNNVDMWNTTQSIDCASVASVQNIINIMLSDTTITTVAQFKTKLQELYDAGTPLILYYELAEPLNLELTEEQKVAMSKINNMSTYKNITNITIDDDLASADVMYKKDLATMINNLQAMSISNASEEV